MNDARLHLMLVHVPVVLTPLAVLFLALGLWRKNQTLSTAAYAIFIGSAIIANIAFQLGEGAEDAVEGATGVLKSPIHDREKTAELSLWFTITLGIASSAALVSLKFAPLKTARFQRPLLILGIITFTLLACVVQDGGKSRRPEVFSEASVQAGPAKIGPQDND